MGQLIAIDPGPEQSAYVVWDGSAVIEKGKEPNSEVLLRVQEAVHDGMPVVIEMIACYGMAVGAEVFETCVWIGRYVQASDFEMGPLAARITRLKVKNHLCHSSKANDANIRQALIDRFGGKEKAIGKKSAPGPLFGVSGDMWAALAVAVTWLDQNLGKVAA